MPFRCFLLILNLFLGNVLSVCGEENLWFIEQDFVKFGKKEAYEEYKKEMLKNHLGNFSTFAAQGDDSLQYIYMVPVQDYCGLGNFLQNRKEYDQSISSDLRIPYFSTLHFTIGSLQWYLLDCSYVPKGKEALTAYRNIYFYLFGILPGNEQIFEAQLQKIAQEQAEGPEICFRSWKMIIGSDVPKYLVAVFATNEKQAKKHSEKLEFITLPMKNILRSQKQGSAVLRKDLSTMSEKNGS
jgi:hypothetical protein